MTSQVEIMARRDTLNIQAYRALALSRRGLNLVEIGGMLNCTKETASDLVRLGHEQIREHFRHVSLALSDRTLDCLIAAARARDVKVTALIATIIDAQAQQLSLSNPKTPIQTLLKGQSA